MCYLATIPDAEGGDGTEDQRRDEDDCYPELAVDEHPPGISAGCRWRSHRIDLWRGPEFYKYCAEEGLSTMSAPFPLVV